MVTDKTTRAQLWRDVFLSRTISFLHQTVNWQIFIWKESILQLSSIRPFIIFSTFLSSCSTLGFLGVSLSPRNVCFIFSPPFSHWMADIIVMSKNSIAETNLEECSKFFNFSYLAHSVMYRVISYSLILAIF
jgi:hypothetical protein